MSTTFSVVKGELLSSKHYKWNTADSLGRGASAVVYLGRQRESGLVVAVKSFHKHLLSSGKNDEFRELELLRHLDHPNIIKLLDIQFQEGSKQPVLIMEYCEGGSLHYMLEQPLYHSGLPEHEYILVLSHVAEGLGYLRNRNIIHRDIKPGNIMRYIQDEGMSIYKLTDFGAARNLEEEEQFDSLYGTEEYLHPSVYEKAVLRIPTGQSFDARVDLWSLGVTFYHAATGKLPFRPFGGRSNKEIMFEIITTKESGVISGIQKSQNGPIEWKRELPESCPLSSGLKSLVIPLLSGLMEPNQERMISYETLFNIVLNISNMMTVSIYHFTIGQELVLYVENNMTFSDLQDTIASQTDIKACDQLLLLEGKRLDEVVDPSTSISDYPAHILKGSIFLFQTTTPAEIRLKDPSISPFPDIQTYSGMEMDYRNANVCCAHGELISRYAKTVSHRQDLIEKGLLCYRLYVESRHNANQTVLELLKQLLLEFDQHLNYFFTMANMLKSIINHFPGNHTNKQKLDDIQREKVVRPVFLKAKERLSEIESYWKNLINRLELTRKSASELASECLKEKCCEKISHHLSVMSGIQSRFRRDKNVRHQMTPHDESIHHFERQKLHKHCKAMKAILVQHCFNSQAKLFHKALGVADVLTRNLAHVKKIEFNLTSVLNCQKLLSDKIVKMQRSCTDLVIHFDSGYNTVSSNSESFISASSSLMSNVSEQTKSLEEKLMDLKVQLEANSEFLHSLGEGASSLPQASDLGIKKVVPPSTVRTGPS